MDILFVDIGGSGYGYSDVSANQTLDGWLQGNWNNYVFWYGLLTAGL